MNRLTIKNINNDEILTDKCLLADKFLSRLQGLLGKKQMAAGTGLLIKPCSSVHTIGMKINIDVVFLSADNEILHIIEKMQPGRLSPIIRYSSCVLELPAGQIKKTGTRIGHCLQISAIPIAH